MNVLTLKDVSLSHSNNEIIASIDLDIKQGEKLAIIGRSGCGKTTLLHYLQDKLAAQAALCSQSRGLVGNLSVFHNIYMGALDRHHWSYNLLNLFWPQKSNKNDITTICHELELTSALHKPVYQLSGGQKQRVALGRALYQNAPILLADEPFTGLDPSMSTRLLERIFTTFQTIIMVLHDKDIAISQFDRIIGLSEGKKLFDLPAAKVTTEMLATCYQVNTLNNSSFRQGHSFSEVNEKQAITPL